MERGGFTTGYADSVSDTEASIRAHPCDPWSIKKSRIVFMGLKSFGVLPLMRPLYLYYDVSAN
jgi:hypothetical protein